MRQKELLSYLKTQLDFLLLPQPEQGDFRDWKLILELMGGIERGTLFGNA